uniref:Reverse transcriptase domain-containing protein n=1 Tax=Oryzias melastigma TaxID=30732 RepID=A0A3B3C5M5_ORYME
IGDLNSDISDCASAFGNHLKQFCEDNGLTLSTGILLPEDNNKATGLDDVSTEHIKFASPKVFPLLSMCFTSFLTHGFLPDSMLDVLTVPVLKNKAGKISCSDNYRPIALASVMSKLFEFILLDKI